VENRARRECKLWNANRRRCRHSPYAGAVNTRWEGQGRGRDAHSFPSRVGESGAVPDALPLMASLTGNPEILLDVTLNIPPSLPPPLPRAREDLVPLMKNSQWFYPRSFAHFARVCWFREFENFVQVRANSPESRRGIRRATSVSLSDNARKTKRNKKQVIKYEHVTVLWRHRAARIPRGFRRY